MQLPDAEVGQAGTRLGCFMPLNKCLSERRASYIGANARNRKSLRDFSMLVSSAKKKAMRERTFAAGACVR